MPAHKRRTKQNHLRPVPRSDSEAGPPWIVVWHPSASTELSEIPSAGDRVALVHASEKLTAEGPRLRFPHQSAIQGEDGKGFRELRPRRGGCPWRAIYRQVDKRKLVILALAPEAHVSKRGFDAAVAKARTRFEALEP